MPRSICPWLLKTISIWKRPTRTNQKSKPCWFQLIPLRAFAKPIRTIIWTRVDFNKRLRHSSLTTKAKTGDRIGVKREPSQVCFWHLERFQELNIGNLSVSNILLPQFWTVNSRPPVSDGL